MERRTALAVALSVAATVGAAGAAFAANVGLLAETDNPVGKLQISQVGTIATEPSTPQTVVVDVPVPAAGIDATAPGVGSADDGVTHHDEHEHEGVDDDD